MLWWGADLTTEKRRQAAALQSIRTGQPLDRRTPVRNGGLEFAAPEIKKKRQSSCRNWEKPALLPRKYGTR